MIAINANPILAQIMVVQGMLDVMPDESSLIGFVSQSIRKVPGVGGVHACNQGLQVPGLDSYDKVCADCRVFSHQDEMIGVCSMGAQGDVLCLAICTLDKYFGFLNVAINSSATFAPYEPYVRNLVNSAAIVMANRLATRLLKLKNEELSQLSNELESRVHERTAELVRLNEQLRQELAERKRMEAELERWARIFEYAEWGVVVGSADVTVMKLMNPAFAKMYGYTVEELTGRPIAQVFEPGAWPDALRETAIAHEKRHHTYESVHIRKDGSIFPVLINVTVIRNAQGKVDCRVVNVQDLTEYKRSEQAVLAQMKLAETFFSHSVGCLVILDRDYNFIRVNEAYARACHRDISEFAGRNHFEMYPSDAKLIFDEVVRSKQPFETFTRAFSFPDQPERGMTYWDWTLVPVLDQQGEIEYLVFSLNEVTEHKQHEVELQHSQIMLRALAAHQVMAKEEERKRIAREIHDELGQRLTALRMDVLMLPKQIAQGHARLSDSVKSMRNSIDGTMRIVRNIATDLRPAALDMGIVMAIEWLLDEFHERMGLECKFHNKVGEAIKLSDEIATGFFRILQESLTNVAKHAQATRVDVTLADEDDRLVLTVRDDGVGLQEHAGKRKSYGLLGMRERVVMLDGSITIQGSAGKGTQVSVSVPYYQKTV